MKTYIFVLIILSVVFQSEGQGAAGEACTLLGISIPFSVCQTDCSAIEIPFGSCAAALKCCFLTRSTNSALVEN
ncbi:hypothetical protein RN001_007096 [Aquatica leii]|uniref:Beta-defensin n=1 Tax=Aquatica leii TaxID=1421715 RepID=A0AAN7P2C2_9COLE|nr:hypothetical protein RN001_007096 [Aquatica leii]